MAKETSKPKRYMFTFEREDGRRLPLIMEGSSPDEALWALIHSRPYLDM